MFSLLLSHFQSSLSLVPLNEFKMQHFLNEAPPLLRVYLPKCQLSTEPPQTVMPASNTLTVSRPRRQRPSTCCRSVSRGPWMTFWNASWGCNWLVMPPGMTTRSIVYSWSFFSTPLVRCLLKASRTSIDWRPNSAPGCQHHAVLI